jgi:type IV fimbrial biogenesis protein FimT
VNGNRGFSLIELMLVLVVVGLMLAIATPAFIGFRTSLSTKGARDALIQDIRMARQLAITRRSPVVMQFGTPPATTNITSYRVHIDTNGDGLAQSSERIYNRNFPKGVALSEVSLNPVDSLRFDVSGILIPGTSGGSIILSSSATRDTLLVSATGTVYVQ